MVLFHAATPGVGGGYVGVDVFFVISGFLITGLPWRGEEQFYLFDPRHRVRLGHVYRLGGDAALSWTPLVPFIGVFPVSESNKF